MNLKKKIITGITTVSLAAALVGGATFALFTDTATNTANTFTAGSVEVTAGTQSVTDLVDLSGTLAPGDTINGKFTVTNTGTLDEWIKVSPNATGALFDGSIDANKATVTNGYGTWTQLASGASVDVNYSVTLPREAGNGYQEAIGNLSFTVDAQQYRNNIDTTTLDSTTIVDKI